MLICHNKYTAYNPTQYSIKNIPAPYIFIHKKNALMSYLARRAFSACLSNRNSDIMAIKTSLSLIVHIHYQMNNIIYTFLQRG